MFSGYRRIKVIDLAVPILLEGGVSMDDYGNMHGSSLYQIIAVCHMVQFVLLT